MTGRNSTPTFESWDFADLVSWAYGTHELVTEQAERICAQQRQIKAAEQVRRELLEKLKGAEDDWK